MGISLSTIQPWTPAFGFGRTCFFAMLMFSTRTRSSSSNTRITLPRRPLSLPAVTTTSSPFLILRMTANSRNSEHFGGQRDDSHELFIAKLARHGPENTRSDRLQLVVQEHGRIRVEANYRSIRTAHALARTHDDGVVDLALLHLAARDGVLDAHLDDITDAGIATMRTAQHLDALQVAGAAVVGRIKECLHLDHGFTSA